MDLDPGGFVSDALHELFSQDKPVITFTEAEDCGLAHIRDVDEAPVYALELAINDYALGFDYVVDETRECFIKCRRW